MSKTAISIAVVGVIAVGGFIYLAGNSAPAAETASTVVSTVKQTVGSDTNASTTVTTPAATTTATTTVSTTSTSTPVTKEFTVVGKSFSFSPSTITVKKGDSVKITFKDSDGFHDLKIDGYDVGTQQLQKGGTETVQFIADKVGTFKYYCSVGTHDQKGMHGTLIVE